MDRHTMAFLGLAVLGAYGSGCATSQARVATAASGADEFELRGSDGLVMHAQLFLPPGDGPFAAALLLPGGRGAAEVGRGWRHHVAFAHDLVEHGLAAMLLDYHGGQRTLLDPRTVADLGVAVDALKTQAKIRGDRIFLLGFSMGGANALRVAGARRDIAGLITFFAPIDLSHSGAPGTRQPIHDASTVACPVLILQGDRDTITPVEQAQALARTLEEHGTPVRLLVFPGAGHGFTYLGAPAGPCCSYDADVAARALVAVVEFMQK
jgi:carboxymethylenebutenolidase